MSEPAPNPWRDAVVAAHLFAVDPVGTQGVVLRARAGMVRDRWLDVMRRALPPSAPVRRVPVNVPDGRLLGGLDLAATLRAGRPVAERGLLAEADGGVVVLAMAERLTAAMVGRLGAVLDTGAVAVERDGMAQRLPTRFGVVALDEGVGDDERPPVALGDRLAFHIDLDPIGTREAQGFSMDPDALSAARARVSAVTIGEEFLQALCSAALAMGVWSLRASQLAVRAAVAAAALAGRDVVAEPDVIVACRLVLSPRATLMPAPPPEAGGEPPPPEEPGDGANDPADATTDPKPDPPPGGDDRLLDDVVLAAAQAAIPADLLARLALASGGPSRGGNAGTAGVDRLSTQRGRPIGSRPGDPRGGGRLNLVETLRAAAPWQRLRRSADAPRRVEVRRDDFRITRFKRRTETTTIFAVDASGSSALHRLAEVKGAVELLLASCYVRRDQVALIAFRGRGAELILPPTRSLVRAKRGLAGLPGGGGTPLAAGLDAATALADAVRRRGQTPIIVLLTDGRANVARDGTGGRPRAEEEALAAAKRLRAAGFNAILVDTAPRPQAPARRLAEAAGARYLPLPYADARRLSAALEIFTTG